MHPRHAGRVPASIPNPALPADRRPQGGMWWIAWLIAVLALMIASPVRAQEFPKFTGLVVDAANIIPADRKAALDAKLAAFQQQSGRQLVVATIPDLQGHAIEDYGYRLGRAWGVGLKDADNGAILIVAPTERKVRIEVGRRLEPIMTDAFSGLIIRNRIIPAFKSGDMVGGIEAGTDAIIQQLSAPDDQAKAQVAKAAQEFDRQHKKSRSGGGVPLGLIFWGLVVLFVILAMRRGRSNAAGPWGQRSYRRDDGGNGWVWLWAASEIARGIGESSRHSDGGGLGGGDGGSSGGGGSDGSWGGGGFTGGGGGDFGGGGASGDW